MCSWDKIRIISRKEKQSPNGKCVCLETKRIPLNIFSLSFQRPLCEYGRYPYTRDPFLELRNLIKKIFDLKILKFPFTPFRNQFPVIAVLFLGYQ
jgi:hypothetical protein